jgi:hypothetical protein
VRIEIAACLRNRCLRVRISQLAPPDRSRELEDAVVAAASGQVILSDCPQLTIGPVPQIIDCSSLIAQHDLTALSRSLALICEYDPAQNTPHKIDHFLHNAGIAFQLVKPTRYFLEYSMLIDASGKIKNISAACRDASLKMNSRDPTLRYQQHHTVSPADARRAAGILPEICNAMAQGFGSWAHPYTSVHRALTLFCQGYSVNLIDLRQLLWAAGLDCLFSSKLDRSKWGSRVICDRLCKLWGNTFQPYANISVPINQKRPVHELQNIAVDAFELRNAYVHGKSLPQAWFSDPDGHLETGYAYQLLECTEIVLRLTLLKIFEDQSLMKVFLDPTLLDSYF